MSKSPSIAEQFPGVNPDHLGLLHSTLRAPSAHNAQPWLLTAAGDGVNYEVHYDQHLGLPEDHDSKDAYLTMGAFVETMALDAPNHGLQVEVTPELTKSGRDLFIANVAINPLSDGISADPLTEWVGKRVTNRNKYTSEPLTPELEDKLRALGNVLVVTEALTEVVLEASMKSWGNPQYVHDLEAWFRNDNDAEDGITPAPFHISATDVLALKVAFKKGKLDSAFMQKFFSASEVKTFASAPTAAVMPVENLEPADMFDAGRRLLRSWVTITSEGYKSQPFSVAVDERSTVPKVANIAGVKHPVSLYRVGKTEKAPRGYSNRKPLDRILVEKS